MQCNKASNKAEGSRCHIFNRNKTGLGWLEYGGANINVGMQRCLSTRRQRAVLCL